MTFFKMLRDESGASAAEYALILAIVGSLIAAGAVALGGDISRALFGAGDKICEDPTGGTSICTTDTSGGTGGTGGTAP